MRFLHGMSAAILLILMPCFLATVTAQDMDTLEGIYRQQYEQYTAQENAVQGQIENLTNLKSQVDNLIGQIGSTPATSYGQEADRYRQMELLLPSAARYSQELDQRQRQLNELQQRKAELRSRILERQTSLPIWWMQ